MASTSPILRLKETGPLTRSLMTSLAWWLILCFLGAICFGRRGVHAINNQGSNSERHRENDENHGDSYIDINDIDTSARMLLFKQIRGGKRTP